MCTIHAILVVEIVLLDVSDHRLRDQVPDAHVSPAEKTDFGAGDVVLDQLLDDVDVVLPPLQCGQGFVDVGTGSLKYISFGRAYSTELYFGGHTSTMKAPKFDKM